MKRLLLMILTCALVLSVGCGKKKEAKASKASKESARVEKQEKESRKSAEHEDEEETISAREQCEEWLKGKKLVEGWNKEQKCFVCMVELSKDEMVAYGMRNREQTRKSLHEDFSMIPLLEALKKLDPIWFLYRTKAAQKEQEPQVVTRDDYVKLTRVSSAEIGKLTFLVDESGLALTKLNKEEEDNDDLAIKEPLSLTTYCAIREGEKTLVSMTTLTGAGDPCRKFYLNRYSVKTGKALRRLLAEHGVCAKAKRFLGDSLVGLYAFWFADPKKK